MKLKIIPVLIISFLILFLGSISLAQNKNLVVLNPQNTTANEIIFLGDIARISGKDAERLKKISLGYSPNIGMIREIPRRKINLAIAAAGFSLNQFSLKSPDKVQIKRKSQKIEQIELRENIEKVILEQFENSEITVKIVRLEIPGPIFAPVGEVKIRTDISRVQNVFAPFYLPLSILINGKTFKRTSAKVEIEAFADVFVAARDLAGNKRIKKSDLELKNIRIEKPLLSYLHKIKDIRGTKTLRDLPKGTVLSREKYIPDIVIKSGDQVRIVGQSGKLQVVVTGEARGSGRIGDRIAVKNLQSNKLIQATVTDEGLVKVYF